VDLKLALGTAQFGLDYGVANKKGKIAKKEVFKILEYAYSIGIDTLDTAYSYGESENVIGEFTAKSGRNFNVISKMPYLNNNSTLTVKKNCLETLQRLGQSRIYGYLIHKFDNIVFHKEDLWNKIISLKQNGLVNKIGVSLYKPEELEFLLDKGITFDIVQIPYNILDQRFKDYFPILKEKNVTIHVRSVFLQGLFFVETERINTNFKGAKDAVEKVYCISKEYSIPMHSLCLCFALINPFVDKIIIGVDSLEHLMENIDSLKYIDKVKRIYGLLKPLRFHDEKVILPYNWNN